MSEGSEYLEAKEMEREGLCIWGFWWLKSGSGRGGDDVEASVCPVTRETMMAGPQAGVAMPSGRGGGDEGSAGQEVAVMIGRSLH